MHKGFSDKFPVYGGPHFQGQVCMCVCEGDKVRDCDSTREEREGEYAQ